MTEVLVERHAERPLNDADLAQMREDAEKCSSIHRVKRHSTLLSADGRELICHFSSPDLESVRLAIKSQRPLPAEVWACSVRDAAGLTAGELVQANVLASWRLTAPVALEELAAIDASAAVCLHNHRVRLLRTFVSNDRRRVLGLFQAADAESVRLALREAEPPVECVWAFRQFLP
jgi:hypothetical protein